MKKSFLLLFLLFSNQLFGQTNGDIQIKILEKELSFKIDLFKEIPIQIEISNVSNNRLYLSDIHKVVIRSHRSIEDLCSLRLGLALIYVLEKYDTKTNEFIEERKILMSASSICDDSDYIKRQVYIGNLIMEAKESRVYEMKLCCSVDESELEEGLYRIYIAYIPKYYSSGYPQCILSNKVNLIIKPNKIK